MHLEARTPEKPRNPLSLFGNPPAPCLGIRSISQVSLQFIGKYRDGEVLKNAQAEPRRQTYPWQ